MKPIEIKVLIKYHENIIRRLKKHLVDKPENKNEPIYKSDIIIEEVNKEFETELRSPTRENKYIFARHIAVFILRNHTRLTWKEIANKVGNSCHTTSIHSYRSAQNLIDLYPEYKEKLNSIVLKLN